MPVIPNFKVLCQPQACNYYVQFRTAFTSRNPSTSRRRRQTTRPLYLTMSAKYAFTKSIREVRFLLCQTSEQSAAIRYVLFSHVAMPKTLQRGIRDGDIRIPIECWKQGQLQRREKLLTLYHQSRSFLTRAYPIMKRSNPNIPILIREAAGTQPKVYARYGTHLSTGCHAHETEQANNVI